MCILDTSLTTLVQYWISSFGRPLKKGGVLEVINWYVSYKIKRCNQQEPRLETQSFGRDIGFSWVFQQLWTGINYRFDMV